MAKTLTSITVNAPAGSVNANTGNTFSFTGTPGFTGTGGVNRYDFKWEVDPGTGYVTIGASTGLSTSNTNPVTNSASTGQQTITVTCSQAGTYTIRMSGAPTTGGSYTVTSATRSVTVSLAGITGTMAAAETGADTSAMTGAVAVAGTLSASESGSDAAAISGTVAVSGSLAASESGSDVFAAAGSVGAISGTLAAQETGSDLLAAIGAVLVSGNLIVAETGADTFSGAGSVASSGITGSMAAAESGADVFYGEGSAVYDGGCRTIHSGTIFHPVDFSMSR